MPSLAETVNVALDGYTTDSAVQFAKLLAPPEDDAKTRLLNTMFLDIERSMKSPDAGWPYLQLGAFTPSPAATADQAAPAVVAVSDDTLELNPADINQLLAQAARDGLGGVPRLRLLVIAIVFVAFLAAPVGELRLPPELQELVQSEVGHIGVALGIAAAIWNAGRKRS